MLIIGCSNSRKLAKKVAKNIKAEYSALTVKKFPDGELYIKFEADLKNKEVILVQTLYPANESLLEIILAGHTAKELGAKKIKLVIPYLAYIRQDKRFNPGEAVSSKIIGKLLNFFDEIITIDPHLHRYKSLNEVFHTKTKNLTANQLIMDYISKKYKKPMIVGPDEESYQWAKQIAEKIKADVAILKKTRYSPKKVKVKIESKIEIKNKEVIIIDDIISTGKTILKTIEHIKKNNPKSISVIGIHGIFADKITYEKIRKNTKEIATTNTISNKHAKIDVTELIANSL